MSRSKIYLNSIGTVSALGGSYNEVLSTYKNRSSTVKKFINNKGDAFPSFPVSSSVELQIEQLAETNQNADRAVQLAMIAANNLVSNSSIDRLEKVGIAIGTSRGTTNKLEEFHKDFIDSSTTPVGSSPTTTFGVISSTVANFLSDEYSIEGSVGIDLSMTCSSALISIAIGIAWLRSGMANHFIAGGTEAPITQFTIAQINALRIYSDIYDKYPCRPLATINSEFRKPTLCLGEGAGLFLLETDCSRSFNSRNSRLEIKGIGLSKERANSASGITETGEGFFDAINICLRDSEIAPGDVDAIVLHAPGTAKGDAAEIFALNRIFEKSLPSLYSTKWLTGHTFGASGALSLELASMLIEGFEPDERPEFPYDISIDYSYRNKEKLRNVIVLGAGFGGITVAVLLSAANI